MHRIGGLSARVVVLIYLLGSPAASQTAAERPPIPTPPDVNVLAQRMPDCKEFRDNCVVCAKLSDGKLRCSNIGIACTPSGEWRCSVPTNAGESTK